MPTIPCYQNPPDPDAWHQVTAPGGYEAWSLHAEDPSTGIRIAGVLGQGCVFDGRYRREYLRYLKRPTVHAPPTPANYPHASFEVYRGGTLWARFDSATGGAQVFTSSSELLDVRMGPNRISLEQGAVIVKWSASPSKWKGPTGGPIEAQFVFRPRTIQPVLDSPLFAEGTSSSKHHWIMAASLCDVSGEFTFAGERISFNGAGHHDHRYGTAPLEATARHWLGGHVLLNDRLLMFHLIKPRDTRSSSQAILIETGESSSKDVCSSATATWRFMRRHPQTVNFGDHLQLSNPRILWGLNPPLKLCYDVRSPIGSGIAYCSAF